MIVYAEVEFIIQTAHSLKEKRAVLQRMIKRTKQKFNVSVAQSTIYIEPVGEADLDEVMAKLKVIFGIGALQLTARWIMRYNIYNQTQNGKCLIHGVNTYKYINSCHT